MPDQPVPRRSRALAITRIAATLAIGAMLGAGLGVAVMADPLASSELPLEERAPAEPLASLPEQPTALIVGDSFSEGIGASKPDAGWARTASDALSWRATIDAIGGTGFTKGNASDGRIGLAYVDRIEAHAASGAEYDVIVLQGGLNDFLATHREEVLATVRAVEAARERWPDAAIVVFGPIEPLGMGVQRSARFEAIREGAEEADATFIDPDVPAPWINERNSIRFDAGDGLHLNDAGYAYIAARFAAVIESYAD
ncbi:SGNH/GDSL hydrolase family protein [Agromyces sp. ZXT2-6]|uniref:SGNH/GDSL hydrolase family protein n=1 Tax=Agromyces sp. ZXT2-6 TaxID=3461153 RepID=UPI0040551A6D